MARGRIINGGKTLFIFGGQLVSSPPFSEYVFSNGTRNDGPNLSLTEGDTLSSFCMVTLQDGNVLIIGGYQNFGHVGIFDVKSETYAWIPSAGTNFVRYAFACTVFNSAKHGNREVVYIGGGNSGNTAEILDYTVTTTWELCKSSTS